MSSVGTIVPLAWPETGAIVEGKWYDDIMRWVGVIKNDMWPVGHAAMLLINHANGEVHYMDFGRYHTPFQKGRVRDKYTDPDVTVYTKAIIKDNEVTNLTEIFTELSTTVATHGVGFIRASVKVIDSFEKAFNKAKDMQNEGAIFYGPLKRGGTNCSRFVAQVGAASGVGLKRKILLNVPYTGSPSPTSNVLIINDFGYYYEFRDGELLKKNNKLFLLKSSK